MPVIGTAVSELVYLGSTGQTVTRTYSEIAGSAATFNPTWTDRGDGWYLARYTPSVAGRHLWYGASNLGIPVDFDWDVLTPAQADPALSLSGPSRTGG